MLKMVMALSLKTLGFFCEIFQGISDYTLISLMLVRKTFVESVLENIMILPILGTQVLLKSHFFFYVMTDCYKVVTLKIHTKCTIEQLFSLFRTHSFITI